MTAIDIEKTDQLIAYLRDRGYVRPDETVTARPLSGGVSSATIYVERAGGDWVLKQSLARLRVAVDWFSDPLRIHCEAAALRWLAELIPGHVPGFVFEDFTDHILAMEAVPQPHANWKQMLLHGQLVEAHVEQFGWMLAAIHRGAAARRDAIARDLGGCHHFDALRREAYYRYTASQVAQAADFIHRLIDETLDLAITFTHGDYSPKNVLVHDDRLILLDHEVAHIGDPAFDVGFSTTHLLSKANHLPEHRARFIAAARRYWETYRAELGAVPWRDGVEARAPRHTLACMLARIDGRSPLEYLSAEARDRQRAIVLRLMADAPASMPDLFAAYAEELNRWPSSNA
ncbi:MAG: phosphotransferase family protein [Candidatus Flexifilum sp.]